MTMSPEEKLAEAEKKIAMLKACLAPFAKEASLWEKPHYVTSYTLIGALPGYKGNLTVGDLIYAKIAYDLADK